MKSLEKTYALKHKWAEKAAVRFVLEEDYEISIYLTINERSLDRIHYTNHENWVYVNSYVQKYEFVIERFWGTFIEFLHNSLKLW
jgi:hypothetical protein